MTEQYTHSSATAIFPLHYAGCIAYWKALLQFESVCLDVHGFFRKQSYHNRCHITGPNGVQALIIPTAGGNFKRPLHEIKISYGSRWQHLHWNSIRSAYGSSPFFTYYDYLLGPFYTRQYDSLADFNLQLTSCIAQLLDCKITFTLSETFVENAVPDFRQDFHAKKQRGDMQLPRYAQVFESKLGFVPNLSILDLLFNKGPEALAYLRQP